MVSKLKSTTTLSNSDGLAPPDEKLILAAAAKAFADNATSASLSGSATQRLAYAVQCRHAAMVANDDKIASLANSAIGTEAFKLLSTLMTKFFLGKPEKTKTMSDDQTANVKTTRTAKQALLTRAVKLAVTLAAHHVTFASFNDKAGVFVVPSIMLVNRAKGDSPLGRLASNKTVLLDNSPAAVNTTAANNEPKMLPIRASVTQLMMANTITADREGAVDSDSDSVATLVKSLHSILCADDDDKSEPVRKDAYPDDVWNMIAELAAWYDATVNNPAWNAKPATASKAA